MPKLTNFLICNEEKSSVVNELKLLPEKAKTFEQRFLLKALKLRRSRIELRAKLFFRPLIALTAVGRRQRKLGNPIQQATLLRRKLVLESVRVNRLLTLFGRHVAQIVDRALHHLPAFRRQILELRKKLLGLLFLLRSQMLPGFHAVQDALLPILRKAAEALQLLLEFLLPLRRKVAELGITLQRLLLLIRRHVFVLPQPLAGMMPWPTGGLLFPCSPIAATSLGER